MMILSNLREILRLRSLIRSVDQDIREVDLRISEERTQAANTGDYALIRDLFKERGIMYNDRLALKRRLSVLYRKPHVWHPVHSWY